MKTALLQCNPVTGDIAGNVEKIAAAVRRAGDVDLCVTPELALSGLNPGDYLSMNDFVEGCRRGLDILAETFKDGPDLLVGAPVISVYDPKLLSNAAVHIHGGTWEVVSRKIRHPASQDPEARFFDRGVSCGIMTLQGWRLGVVLCESDSSDEFGNVQGVGHNPLLDLISRGVDAIAYMTATPYTKDRAGEESAILSHVAARHHVHLLCVNAVGGNDGLVYAGQSTAFDPTGALYARGKAFEEDVVVLDTAGGSAPVAPDFASWEEGVFGALVLGTRDFVNKCGLTRGIVGLSGGIDSPVSSYMKKAKVQQMSAAVNSGRKWVCAPVREYSRQIAEYERQKNQRETAFATINLRNGIFIHKSSIPAHKRYGKSKVLSISHILSFTEPNITPISVCPLKSSRFCIKTDIITINKIPAISRYISFFCI